jgi:prepilin-type N-terminal cleavage/methylation domain-containing protein
MEKGFTLIELLVTLAIIGILSAIVVPEFKSYRAKAYDARAQADARNVALSQEAYYLENEEYLSCKQNECRALPGISRLSDGVSLSVEAQDDSFVITSEHENGSGKRFIWDSKEGGFIEN